LTVNSALQSSQQHTRADVKLASTRTWGDWQDGQQIGTSRSGMRRIYPAVG
jgi:hypothetical protein